MNWRLNIKRRHAGVAFILLLGMLALAYRTFRTPAQIVTGTHIVARVSGCNKDVQPNESAVAVVGSSWRDDKFVVTATEVFTCGPYRLVNPAYEVSGTEVRPRWGWTLPENAPVAACYCGRNLRFEITGLEQRHYTVRAATPERK